MDTQHIEDMIQILENSWATELEVKSGETLVRIVKSQQSKAKSGSDKPKPARQIQPQAQPKPLEDQYITAPMVGIFHTGSANIEPDSNVAVGQMVGVIESMKLHNELVSRVAGVVKEVLIEDGTPVEYGQPLFRVEQVADE